MILTDFLLGIVGLAMLMVPGWLVARAVAIPQPLLAGFVMGAVVLVSLALALDSLHLPLNIVTVGGGWGVLITIAAVFRFKVSSSVMTRPSSGDGSSGWSEDWAILLPLVPMLAVVVYRACAQPLFGVDTVFRWNYLAEQILARHSMEFYPPVTAADYEIYSWPDGIAPAVSLMYFGIYSIAGAPRPGLTAPLVIFQFILVLIAVHALGRKTFSPRAAAFACALVACSPVIAWATAMGQETGLMAIALAALLLYLPRSRAQEEAGALLFAALAASLGALAREYGVVLPLLGIGLCLARRLSLRACSTFAVVAALGAAPWYARNWMHTGNPFFNLSLGGIFPVNEVHAWLNQSYQTDHGWANLPPEAPRLFVVNCLAALIGAMAGGLLYFRQASALLIAAAVIIALWAISVGYTAAGFIYSLRVLSPALVLSAVLGGAALARWVPGERLRNAITIGLTLFAVDASLRVLTLPANVYRVPPGEWLAVGRAIHDYHQRPIYREIVRVAGNERILVLGPNALLTTHSARTVPLWSPEVRFLFDDSLSPSQIADRLRGVKIGFVLLNTGGVNERFLARSAFFRNSSGTLQLVWSDNDMILLRVSVPLRG